MGAARVREEDRTPEARAHEATRKIVAMLDELIDAKLDARGARADDCYTPENTPFGRTKKGRRRHNELARSGAVEAFKVRGQWMIPRKAMMEYLKKHAVKIGRRPEDEDVDEYIKRVNNAGGDRR